MSHTPLPPGNYKLEYDVVNPKPDRRQKYDWRAAPVWVAGDEFLVVNESGPEDHPEIVFPVISMVGHRYSHHVIREYTDPKRFLVLREHLRPCSESLDALFTRIGCSSNFAQWLARSGKMDAAQLTALWAEYEES